MIIHGIDDDISSGCVMPVYQYIGWYLASSNSLKTQQYQYLYQPRTMILADPYHQISPSLEWRGNGASYPFLNPSNFIEYPTVYDLSRPHLPYDLTSHINAIILSDLI